MPNDDFKFILNELRVKEGDELVNEFERIFKSRIPKDIDDLALAHKEQDFQKIKSKAHLLATTLLTLKFRHGYELTEELERAIDNDQNAQVLRLTGHLIEYLNSALIKI